MDERTVRLKAAVACYRARQKRTEHPKGEFTESHKARTWKIDPSERQECCDRMRPSNLGGRQKFIGHWLNSHCRTIAHVANLFNLTETELHAALKTKQTPSGQQDLF